MSATAVLGMGGLNGALAGTATLVATAFTLSTADRWIKRRQPHELAWTIAMGLFAIGSACLWWAESTGWNLFVFRMFFLAGAVLNVSWLALGTVYLLGGQQLGNRVRQILIWLSGFATGIVLVAQSKAEVVADQFPTGKEVFGIAPRILAAVGSGVAALVIIGGAVWSIIRVIRGRIPAVGEAQRHITSSRRHAASNSLIAIGTLVLSGSGTLAGRMGEDRAFAITLLVGVVVLFSGFLVASTQPKSMKDKRITNALAK